MVRHAGPPGIRRQGRSVVTRLPAASMRPWGSQALEKEGALAAWPTSATSDYLDVPEGESDACHLHRA